MRRSTATPAGAPEDGQIGRLRLTSRLAAAFLLDIVAITRGDGHILDTLLTSAIIQANVQEIIHRPDLQAAFAESDEVPPDELRRPVSMNALANSLGLPFETVRRRVKGLVREGWCVFVDGGVIVPAAVLSAPKLHVDAFRGYERLRAFYYQLSDLGLLRDLPPPSVELSGGAFPIRAVARLVGAYVLRVAEPVAAFGDLRDILVLLEIFRSNVEHLPHDLRGGAGFRPGDMLSDALRKPIPVTRLAARLGLPPETARRRVAAVMARGLCVRTPGGLIVPAAALARPLLLSALVGNASNLQRMFAALAQLGVLQVWDSVRAPP